MTMLRLALAAALCAGAASGASARRKPMTAQEWKGQHGGPARPGVETIQEAAAWKALWRRLGADAPKLDFTRSCAVAVFAGERMTGGYSIEFLEPAARGDDLVARWRLVSPSAGGFTIQVLTQPWAVRAYPRPKGAVVAEQAEK